MTADHLSRSLTDLRGALPVNALGQIHLSAAAAMSLLNALRDAAAIAYGVENELDALRWRIGRMTDPLRDMASAARALADEIEPAPAPAAAPDALDARIERIKSRAADLTARDMTPPAPRDATATAARMFAAAGERSDDAGPARLRLVVDNPPAVDMTAAMAAIAEAIGAPRPIDALEGDRPPADPLGRDCAEDGA